ncbi:hypothetical protein EV175_006446 [Coemansia sp. RSA 1933]|nr:hypothetical protein EV175_006446 [Coemansia sp. RSA 1933]
MEFDDDEELGDVQFEYNEEESREKDEQKRRNHASGFGSADEDDGAEEANDGLDDDGKTIKKLMRKREDAKEYESDKNEEDPYLSLSEIDSDESDSDNDAAKKEGEQQQQQQKGENAGNEAAAKGGQQKSVSPVPSTASTNAAHPPPSVRGGSSVSSVAKKRKRISVGGPLSSANDSHEKSLKHAKSTHQLARAQSSGGGGGNKGSSSSDLITRQEIIDLIKSGVNTTKELIGCVRRKLKANPENKKRIHTIVKDVAVLRNDRLALKKPN